MTRQIFRKYTFLILSIFHFIWGQISDFKIKEYFPLPQRISELGLKPTKFNWSIGEHFIEINPYEGINEEFLVTVNKN